MFYLSTPFIRGRWHLKGGYWPRRRGRWEDQQTTFSKVKKSNEQKGKSICALSFVFYQVKSNQKGSKISWLVIGSNEWWRLVGSRKIPLADNIVPTIFVNFIKLTWPKSRHVYQKSRSYSQNIIIFPPHFTRTATGKSRLTESGYIKVPISLFLLICIRGGGGRREGSLRRTIVRWKGSVECLEYA